MDPLLKKLLIAFAVMSACLVLFEVRLTTRRRIIDVFSDLPVKKYFPPPSRSYNASTLLKTAGFRNISFPKRIFDKIPPSPSEKATTSTTHPSSSEKTTASTTSTKRTASSTISSTHKTVTSVEVHSRSDIAVPTSRIFPQLYSQFPSATSNDTLLVAPKPDPSFHFNEFPDVLTDENLDIFELLERWQDLSQPFFDRHAPPLQMSHKFYESPSPLPV